MGDESLLEVFSSTSDVVSDDVKKKLGEDGLSSVEDSGVMTKVGVEEQLSSTSPDDAFDEGSHSRDPSESLV